MKTKTRLFAVLLALSLLFSVSASAADGYLRGMEGYSYSNPAFSMNVMDDTLFLLNGKKLQAFTSAIEEPALICDFAKNPIGVSEYTLRFHLLSCNDRLYILDPYGGTLYPMFGEPIKLNVERISKPIEGQNYNSVSIVSAFVTDRELFAVCFSPDDTFKQYVLCFQLSTGEYGDLTDGLGDLLATNACIAPYDEAPRYLISNSYGLYVAAYGKILETVFTTDDIQDFTDEQIFDFAWDGKDKFYFVTTYYIRSYDRATKEFDLLCTLPDNGPETRSFAFWDNRLALLTTSGLYTYDLDPERAQQEELILYERFSDTW